MRYAILSDVHANADALRAVLVDARDMHADRLVCLGDVLGYGPDPVAALETVYSRVHVCLAGNHDDAVCGRCPTDGFNAFAAAAVARQRQALTAEALGWLRKLPYTCELGGFACAHGDFSDPPAFNYILDPADAMPSWEVRSEQLLFVGHSHQPGIFVIGGHGVPHGLAPADFVLEEGKRYIVNVGSVGYPRSGLCRSFYCLYDDRSRTVLFRSLPFDLEGYRAKMGGKGLDEAPWVAARAQERAVPAVRSGANFGCTPPVAAKVPVKRRSLTLPLLAALGVVAVAAGGVGLAMKRTPAVKTEVKPEVVVKEVPPPAPVAEMLKTQTLKLPPDAKRVFYSIRLEKGSAPVKAHVAFKGADGRMLSAEEDWFTVKKSRKRSVKGRGLAVPDGAAYATFEIGKMRLQDVCAVAHTYFSLKEEEKEQ